MRLYLISFFLAFIFLLPELAEALDFSFLLQGVLAVPATGLGYMAVFFHEIGHTLARWIFGYPALPSFDFQHGGGMTYDFERVDFLLWSVYAAAASAIFYFFKNFHYGLSAALSVALVFHLLIAFNQGHEVFAVYMGHGAEILIGCFCIWRGVIGHSEFGSAEKWLNMIFGMNILGRHILMSWSLMHDEISRMAYAEQKGGKCQGDFTRIAEILNVKLEAVAAGSLLLLFVFLFLTVFLARREKE